MGGNRVSANLVVLRGKFLIYATNLDVLLTLKDEEFVQGCFQAILHRQPQPDEAMKYLAHMQNKITKATLIVRIALSPEARSVLSDFPGLKSAIKCYKQTQLPVIGWLFALIYLMKNRKRRVRPGKVIRLSSQGQEILSRIEEEIKKHRHQESLG